MRKGEPLCATDSSHVTVSGPGRSLVMPLRPNCSLPEKGPQAPYLLPGAGWVWVGWGESGHGWAGGCISVMAGAPGVLIGQSSLRHFSIPHTAGKFGRSINHVNYLFGHARTGVVEQDVVALLVSLVARLGAGPAGVRRRLLREKQHRAGSGTKQQLHWSMVRGWWVVCLLAPVWDVGRHVMLVRLARLMTRWSEAPERDSR